MDTADTPPRPVVDIREMLQAFESEFIHLVAVWEADAPRLRQLRYDIVGLIDAVGASGRALIDANRTEALTGGADEPTRTARLEHARVFFGARERMASVFGTLPPDVRRLFDAIETTPRDEAAATAKWREQIEKAGS
jgi:hypothetical protein